MHICVKCKKPIVGKLELMIHYYTSHGHMHHDCGKTMSFQFRHGHDALLCEVEKIEEERSILALT